MTIKNNKILDYMTPKYPVTFNSDPSITLACHRTELADMFHDFGYTSGAEVGVYRGEFSKALCDKNPELKMICVDPWDAFADYSKRRLNKDYDMTKELLAPYQCKIIRETSMEAVKNLLPNTLDFVYIDAGHTFDEVMEDIIEWSRIVKPGGIVSGHDYKCFRHKEISLSVSTAVKAYTKAHNIGEFFVIDRDRSNSWLFVKI